ncbi:MAG: hypothetical protein FJW27_19560 [Acidimicrobiia bacterium]|nr:hypothetical protein [Acidimicrobiia bacterium]
MVGHSGRFDRATALRKGLLKTQNHMRQVPCTPIGAGPHGYGARVTNLGRAHHVRVNVRASEGGYNRTPAGDQRDNLTIAPP